MAITLDGTGGITTPAITNLVRIQRFTSYGTYTPSTNATKAIVHVVGGGGAGGGCENTGSGELSAGAGGGGGGIIVSDVIDVSGGSYTSTITIGAGGTGASNDSGVAGGDTTYADGTITLTATGGKGGTKEAASSSFRLQGSTDSSPNTVSGHTPIINTMGQEGGTAFLFADADISNMVASGQGGSALPYGTGGKSRGNFNASGGAGLDATGFGSGGSGAFSHSSSGGNAAGGDGTDGVVIIYEYL